ncbi:MAG TPA: acyl-CoA dehydrogenase family protein [Conexibacter sp.]|nr:acyl-CoA dehydrogenase family protein [Conexibacter sp.]
MNFDLSDEQVLLREAARDAFSRVRTVEAARAALEEGELPDLWPTARQAGWTGLLVDEAHGGAGLSAIDAMLVMAEAGRVLASVPLLGHLPATAILDATTGAGSATPGPEGVDGETLRKLASGEWRAAYVPARPGDDLDPAWTTEPRSGRRRAPAPEVVRGDEGLATVNGTASWVPDAVGADVLVAVGVEAGQPVAVAFGPGAEGVRVEPASGVYDATRPLGHVTFENACGHVLAAGEEELRRAWFLAHALIAAEALGAIEECLERSVAYAKERYTFGRPIGSYQAVKHALTEVLRRQENTRSLLYYAGWAYDDKPDELAAAASAARAAGGAALDFAARELISVHGGIGATWEHDAPLFFRRAQLSRRLLGGTGDAVDRLAGELLAV